MIREFRDEDKGSLKHFPFLGRVVEQIDFSPYSYKFVAEVNDKVVGFLYAR